MVWNSNEIDDENFRQATISNENVAYITPPGGPNIYNFGSLDLLDFAFVI